MRTVVFILFILSLYPMGRMAASAIRETEAPPYWYLGVLVFYSFICWLSGYLDGA